MHFVDLILKKRNGGRLSEDEIRFFVSGYVEGRIPDYQAAAMLMAIWFQKMDERETADLTFAMRDSGDTIDLSAIAGNIADKHSTGGVADTTTLITAPVVAACGLKVAKMSGRGLGHTGGTLDKLDSIPGFSTEIEMDRFRQIVADCGLSIIGQTSALVPADKMLYALRDTTGTIDNISLISASIMSKKLASGSDTIVLDVKMGNGAFMKTKNDAECLARAMVSIGRVAGKKVEALISDMNQPLGNAVGNSLEVVEAIEVLSGKYRGDLCEVSLTLAARMLLLSDMAEDELAARQMAEDALGSGRALDTLAAMITAQGGDAGVCANTSLLPRAASMVSVTSPKSGYILEIATGEIGMAALLLGAGRATKADTIDLTVGIWLKKRLGDYVNEGEELAIFHVNDTTKLEEARSRFIGALVLGDKPPVKRPLIHAIIS